ncbi:MAG: hypothetical protein U1E76_13790 [Planctomycetota bacterium]
MLTASVMLLAASWSSAWSSVGAHRVLEGGNPYHDQQAVDAARDGDRRHQSK